MYSCYFNEASVLQTSVETVHAQQAGVRAGAGDCRPQEPEAGAAISLDRCFCTVGGGGGGACSNSLPLIATPNH